MAPNPSLSNEIPFIRHCAQQLGDQHDLRGADNHVQGFRREGNPKLLESMASTDPEVISTFLLSHSLVTSQQILLLILKKV